MKVRWFHASPKRFHVRDVLSAHFSKTGIAGEGWLHLTASEVLHYTIDEVAVRDNYYIYEVNPLGKLKWEGNFDSALCQRAEVVRCVGRARGIMNARPTVCWWKETYHQGAPEQAVRRWMLSKWNKRRKKRT
jgi:hypothetical protein